MFSHSIVFNSLWPHELLPTRLPYPSLTPRVCSNSCPLSQWCHPATSSSVAPFSSCLQSFPASGSFPVSWLFSSGGQTIAASASASALPSEYSGLISFRIYWFDLPAVQGTLKSLFQHHRKSSEDLIYSEVGGEGDNRGWDGWITSLTQWTWVWANSGRWWRTRKPGMLQFTGSQTVGHDWATVQHCNNTV